MVESARRITLPSASILLTFISESSAVILITRSSDFLSFSVTAVYVPSISALIDFVKSLSFGPIPTQASPSQFPTSLPIVPSTTLIFKLPPSLVVRRVFATPAFRRFPLLISILISPFDVM